LDGQWVRLGNTLAPSRTIAVRCATVPRMMRIS